ncbi:MAG: hypothetical protein WBI07_10780 [Mobilitalea sp.]
MLKMDLGGTWTLKPATSEEELEGHLPGCTYLDLMANGKLDDPFWGSATCS